MRKVKMPKEPKMIKQICKVCGNKFQGIVKIDICPNCYI